MKKLTRVYGHSVNREKVSLLWDCFRLTTEIKRDIRKRLLLNWVSKYYKEVIWNHPFHDIQLLCSWSFSHFRRCGRTNYEVWDSSKDEYPNKMIIQFDSYVGSDEATAKGFQMKFESIGTGNDVSLSIISNYILEDKQKYQFLTMLSFILSAH